MIWSILKICGGILGIVLLIFSYVLWRAYKDMNPKCRLCNRVYCKAAASDIPDEAIADWMEGGACRACYGYDKKN